MLSNTHTHTHTVILFFGKWYWALLNLTIGVVCHWYQTPTLPDAIFPGAKFTRGGNPLFFSDRVVLYMWSSCNLNKSGETNKTYSVCIVHDRYKSPWIPVTELDCFLWESEIGRLSREEEAMCNCRFRRNSHMSTVWPSSRSVKINQLEGGDGLSRPASEVIWVGCVNNFSPGGGGGGKKGYYRSSKWEGARGKWYRALPPYPGDLVNESSRSMHFVVGPDWEKKVK